jgi:hypothetical protein
MIDGKVHEECDIVICIYCHEAGNHREQRIHGFCLLLNEVLMKVGGGGNFWREIGMSSSTTQDARNWASGTCLDRLLRNRFLYTVDQTEALKFEAYQPTHMLWSRDRVLGIYHHSCFGD